MQSYSEYEEYFKKLSADMTPDEFIEWFKALDQGHLLNDYHDMKMQEPPENYHKAKI